MPAVTVDRPEAGVAVVRLARPASRNALTPAAVGEFGAALEAIERDPACRVVVLAGEGQGFCAGLNLKQVLGGGAPQGPIAWMALQEQFAGLILRLRRMPQPVVAAVRGAAVGAGFGLALGADVRLASPSAKFLVGAVRIGLSAGECGISYHLPRIVGAARAFEIMLTGRAVDAAEALSIGLVSRIAEEGELLAEAMAAARMIAANSPYAVKHTKQLMWKNLDAPSLEAAVELENHVQVAALMTQDFSEGVVAFAEKRAPRFQGR